MVDYGEWGSHNSRLCSVLQVKMHKARVRDTGGCNMHVIWFDTDQSIAGTSANTCSTWTGCVRSVAHTNISWSPCSQVASIPIAIEIVCTTTLALGSRLLAKRGAIVTRLGAIEDLAGAVLVCYAFLGRCWIWCTFASLLSWTIAGALMCVVCHSPMHLGCLTLRFSILKYAHARRLKSYCAFCARCQQFYDTEPDFYLKFNILHTSLNSHQWPISPTRSTFPCISEKNLQSRVSQYLTSSG